MNQHGYPKPEQHNPAARCRKSANGKSTASSRFCYEFCQEQHKMYSIVEYREGETASQGAQKPSCYLSRAYSELRPGVHGPTKLLWPALLQGNGLLNFATTGILVRLSPAGWSSTGTEIHRPFLYALYALFSSRGIGPSVFLRGINTL